ncbi:MAG: VOC family protein [Pelagimonas sp.]|jgi:hypothetical protein|nr:VOC family protein [Pelagimonas sp.]
MLELDHIVVVGESLDEAAAHVEAQLGTPLLPGGAHAVFGTHNRLLGLSPGLYLEAIAIDPAAPPPARARWFGLDHFQGAARLDKWVLRVADMDAALEHLPMAGQPVAVQRGGLSWTMAVPEDGKLPFDGVFPALIQWHSHVPPGKILPGGDLRLNHLTICHPQVDQLRALLWPLLSHQTRDMLRFDLCPEGAAGLRAEIHCAALSADRAFS